MKAGPPLKYFSRLGLLGSAIRPPLTGAATAGLSVSDAAITKLAARGTNNIPKIRLVTLRIAILHGLAAVLTSSPGWDSPSRWRHCLSSPARAGRPTVRNDTFERAPGRRPVLPLR